MTPSELKYQYETNNPNGHFFDRKTMKFFGDTMKNYGVVTILPLEVYKLYRKRPVKNGLQKDHYFDMATFQEVGEWALEQRQNQFNEATGA